MKVFLDMLGPGRSGSSVVAHSRVSSIARAGAAEARDLLITKSHDDAQLFVDRTTLQITAKRSRKCDPRATEATTTDNPAPPSGTRARRCRRCSSGSRSCPGRDGREPGDRACRCRGSRREHYVSLLGSSTTRTSSAPHSQAIHTKHFSTPALRLATATVLLEKSVESDE